MNKNKILIELSQSPRTKYGKEDFIRQSFPQRVFSAIWEVESEVNNGGFSQYFGNGPDCASFVVTALETISAPKTAEICRRAIAKAFPSGLPPAATDIQSAASDFSSPILESLEALDQEFFSYPHDLTALLFAYVSAHPEEFGSLPERD